MDDSTARTDQRLIDLEIKASYTEDLLDTLNRQVAAQQAQIDALVRRVSQLQDQMPERYAGSLRDELPPHY
jgi:SlyX protein